MKRMWFLVRLKHAMVTLLAPFGLWCEYRSHWCLRTRALHVTAWCSYPMACNVCYASYHVTGVGFGVHDEQSS